MRNRVIYRHLKPNGEVFYIGIGEKLRAYSKKDRNKHWHNIVNKYGYEVQILKSNLTLEEACELECMLIEHYGRRVLGTGSLVNITDGGEGVIGYKHSEESKLKMSEDRKGRKHTEETRAKISEALKGNTNTKGYKHSKETREKMSLAKKGKPSHRKGKKLSEETKAKMSKPKRGKKVIDTVTGVIFDSIKSAALENNINEVTLRNWLLGLYKNKTNLEFYGT